MVMDVINSGVKNDASPWMYMIWMYSVQQAWFAMQLIRIGQKDTYHYSWLWAQQQSIQKAPLQKYAILENHASREKNKSKVSISGPDLNDPNNRAHFFARRTISLSSYVANSGVTIMKKKIISI